ncbi:MAG: cytochrome c biogenesis protein ResB [Thermodesulfobacteriota bacterium]
MKRILLSRTTVTALYLALLLLVILAALLPLAEGNLPRFMGVAASSLRLLGVDRLSSSLPFLALLGLTLLTVCLSLVRQVRAACRKTLGPGRLPAELYTVSSPEPEIRAVLRRAGYLRVFSDKGCERFLKHPWGFWGSTVLHLGLILTTAGALAAAGGGQEGRLRLAAGEGLAATSPLPEEKSGILAGSFRLPFGIRLQEVDFSLWKDGSLRHLGGVLELADEGGDAFRTGIGVNRVVSRRSIRIYQTRSFGNTFLLRLRQADDTTQDLRLDLPYPPRWGAAGYGSFTSSAIPHRLDAKYLADSGGSAYDIDPVLTVRLRDFAGIVGETQLRSGQEGSLGPYRVRLLAVGRWSEFHIARMPGMYVVFTGFFLIISGSFLVFCAPAREMHLLHRDGRLMVGWHGGRFAAMFREEFEQIVNPAATHEP